MTRTTQRSPHTCLAKIFLTFNNWRRGRAALVHMHAGHEFGPALGYAHEQNRPDTPDTRTSAPPGPERCRRTAPGVWDFRNSVGASPSQLGVGDFNRDGVDDAFRADGQTLSDSLGVPGRTSP